MESNRIGHSANVNRAKESVQQFAGTLLSRTPGLGARVLYWRAFRRWPRVRRPELFTEFLMRRKAVERDPRYPLLSDKLAVRSFVADRVGAEHLASLYAQGATWEEIGYESLPNKFVLKANHYGVEVVRNKQTQSERDLRALAERWLETPYGRIKGEWWYDHIPRRLLVEELLVEADGSAPNDYKFDVFHGRCVLVRVTRRDSSGREFLTYFDPSWHRLDVVYTNARTRYRYPTSSSIPRPANLPQMLQVAESIGAGLDFARVDLYNLSGRIVFGEVTLCPTSGYIAFGDNNLDKALGRLWRDASAQESFADLRSHSETMND